MRRRATFRDNDLSVGEASEFLLYGPRSAREYAEVLSLRGKLREEVIKTRPERKRALRMLRNYGYSFKDACDIVSRLDLGPTLCDLARFGYDRIYSASDADTWAYSDAMDAGQPEPFTPCGSPREAYEKYEVAA